MSEQAPQVAPKALEAKVAHLGFIQDIINRMASNSFLLKGWAVTLVVAILTLSADSKLQNAIPISYIPVIMFWYLDSFFLRQERLYRCLYGNVASDGGSGHGFSMETQPYSREVPGTLALLLSSTLRVFYVTIILVITAVWQLALR